MAWDREQSPGSGVPREQNGERAPSAGDAVDADLTSMRLRDGLGDTEAQAGASFSRQVGIGGAVEALKNALLLFLGQANAGV